MEPDGDAGGVMIQPEDAAYGLMYYQKDKIIAVREKMGSKRQIISVGGKACSKTKAQLWQIGKDMIKDLNAGVSVVNAKSRGRVAAGLD